ncbi:hypothetical protein TKK_0018160 [Trichogramma kaykai]
MSSDESIIEYEDIEYLVLSSSDIDSESDGEEIYLSDESKPDEEEESQYLNDDRIECISLDNESLSRERASIPNSKPANVREYKCLKIWKDVPACKAWLHIDPAIKNKVWCTACGNKPLVAMWSNVKSHGQSAKHCRKLGLASIPSDEEFNINLATEENVRVEAALHIKIVAAMVELDLSFKKTKDFVNILKSFAADDLNDVKLSYTKAHAILVRAIGHANQVEMAQNLNRPFSILVDESTDVTEKKLLSISIRHPDYEAKTVKTKLWDMVPIFKDGIEGKATAEVFFERTKESFEKMGVDIRNICAVSVDTCNAMIGENKGYISRMQSYIPNVISVHCPAHLMSLCIKYAMEEIPPHIMELIKDMYKLFRSGNKKHDFVQTQREFNLPIHKILRHHKIRWSSLFACTERIIEQWDALYDFTMKLSEDRNEKLAGKIYDAMSQVDCKSYFHLISAVLQQFNHFIVFIQSDDCILTSVYEKLEKCYINIASIIIKKKYLSAIDIGKMDLFNESQYLSFKAFNVDEYVRDALIVNDTKMFDFCRTTYNFVMQSLMQILYRFRGFDLGFLKTIVCLNPINVLSTSFRTEKVHLLQELMQHCAILIDDDRHSEDILYEWDQLHIVEHNIQNVELNRDDPIKFWMFIGSLQVEGTGQYLFQYLPEFAVNALSVPSSNADPERRFSHVNYVKNKFRNRMTIETLAATLRAKQEVNNQKAKNGGFIASKTMIDAITLTSIWPKRDKKRIDLATEDLPNAVSEFMAENVSQQQIPYHDEESIEFIEICTDDDQENEASFENDDLHWFLIIVCFANEHIHGNSERSVIFIFDSLSSNNCDREEVSLVKKFLNEELKERGYQHEFTDENLKAVNLKVPQQSNGNDCGLFLMKYVEQFFLKPIPDFKNPNRKLKQWFSQQIMNSMRQKITSIISNLRNQQLE